MDLNLRGKTVIVTGGSKGIGSGISEVFAQEGANVVINYRSDAEGSQAFSRNLSDRYDCQTIAVQGDVGNEEDVVRIFDQTMEAFGQLDILVNNAGKGIAKMIWDITLEDWHQAYNDNLTGMFLMSREFARRQIAAKRPGKIVNVLSKASLTTTTPGRACYVANKTGEMGLTKQLAVDLTPYGIHVNGVMPGFVRSSMTDRSKPEDLERRIARVPIKRLGEPNEIGYMVAYLASDKAVLNVGSIVDVTGGLLLGF
jgi:NAD(P)-dependent dehydrogenase (short-subunit alcohol dehydrogenase family)